MLARKLSLSFFLLLKPCSQSDGISFTMDMAEGLMSSVTQQCTQTSSFYHARWLFSKCANNHFSFSGLGGGTQWPMWPANASSMSHPSGDMSETHTLWLSPSSDSGCCLTLHIQKLLSSPPPPCQRWSPLPSSLSSFPFICPSFPWCFYFSVWLRFVLEGPLIFFHPCIRLEKFMSGARLKGPTAGYCVKVVPGAFR